MTINVIMLKNIKPITIINFVDFKTKAYLSENNGMIFQD